MTMGSGHAADQFNADDQSLFMNFGRHYVVTCCQVDMILIGVLFNVYLSRLKVYLVVYLIAILSCLGILLHCVSLVFVNLQ
jgi:hypothetical protein